MSKRLKVKKRKIKNNNDYSLDKLKRRLRTFRNIEKSRDKYFEIVKSIGINYKNDIRSEFLSRLPKKDHYVLFPVQYMPTYFNHGDHDNPKVYRMNNFEDVCKMVFSSTNLFDKSKSFPSYNKRKRQRIKETKKMIKENFKKPELTDMLKRYCIKDTIPHSYLRQIDYLLCKLARVPTDDEKRKMEKEYIMEKMKYTLFVEMCGIDVSDNLIFIIFSYLNHKIYLKSIGLVCENFYLLFLKTWKTLKITQHNLYKIPILVLWNVKTINLKTNGFLKESYKYLIKESLSIETLYITPNSVNFFKYMEIKKKTLTSLIIDNLGDCNIYLKKELLPNVRRFKYMKDDILGVASCDVTDFLGQIIYLHIGIYSFYRLPFYKNLKSLFFESPKMLPKISKLTFKKMKNNLTKINFMDDYIDGRLRYHGIKTIIAHNMEVETIRIFINIYNNNTSEKYNNDLLNSYFTLLDELDHQCKYISLNLIGYDLKEMEKIQEYFNEINTAITLKVKKYKIVKKKKFHISYSHKTVNAVYRFKYKLVRINLRINLRIDLKKQN